MKCEEELTLASHICIFVPEKTYDGLAFFLNKEEFYNRENCDLPKKVLQEVKEFYDTGYTESLCVSNPTTELSNSGCEGEYDHVNINRLMEVRKDLWLVTLYADVLGDHLFFYTPKQHPIVKWYKDLRFKWRDILH